MNSILVIPVIIKIDKLQWSEKFVLNQAQGPIGICIEKDKFICDKI